MSKAIKVENLSKAYQTGQFGTNTISGDVQRWWMTKILGKEDPFLIIGEKNDRRLKGESNIIWSLKDINFEVERGEALGIIGQNGAGKSTILKILSRVTSPTKGGFKIRGRVASLLEVGTGFHPELTGKENIFLNGAILGMRKHVIKRRLEEIVEFAGIERYLETPVKRYSSGMYVRLAFAVAAHLDAEILVIDEVLAVGDSEFQKKCIGKMGDISKGEGRTILFVSHNLDSISVLTDRSMVLDKGNLDFMGNTNEALSKYRNRFHMAENEYKNKLDEKLPAGIESLKILTTNLNGIHLFGQPLIFEFVIKANKKIRGASLSFQLFNEKDIAIMHAWVFDSEYNFCRTEGMFKLNCIIDNPRLYMGKYFVTVHFGESPGGTKFQTLNKICSFEITMEGIYREFRWEFNACTYLEKYNWEIQRID